MTKIIAISSSKHQTRDYLTALIKAHFYLYSVHRGLGEFSMQVKYAKSIIRNNMHEDDCFDGAVLSYTDRFAKPIKDYLSGLLGVPAERLNEESIKNTVFEKTCPLTVREMHKVMDKLKILMKNDALYANALFNRVESLRYAPMYIFIKDLRFEIEAQETVIRDGYIISCANDFYPEIQKYCSHKVHLVDDINKDLMSVLSFMKYFGFVGMEYANDFEQVVMMTP